MATCRKDDTPSDPISQLPPATQTGANMMGCLIDGKPMSAGASVVGAMVNCDYYWANNKPYFFLSGKDTRNRQLLKPGLSINALSIRGEARYALWQYMSHGFTLTFSDGRGYQPRDTCGILTITRLDTVAKIISGTFSFQAQNQQDPNDRINVTDGRFDFQYYYHK